MRSPRTFALLVSLSLVSGGSAVALAATAKRPVLVGRQPDGTTVTSVLQRLTPSGHQLELGGRANRSALSPDGRTLAIVLTESDRDLALVDVATRTVRQRIDPGGEASNDGVAWTPDGRLLVTSLNTGEIAFTPISAAGTAGATTRLAMPTTSRGDDPVPGGIAITADGKTAYVALSRSNSVEVVDLATRTLTTSIAVGNAPHSVLLLGGKAYVTDEGGRPAGLTDSTNDSAGTPIVTDGTHSSSSTGTVDVITLSSGAVTRLPVGLHPTTMTTDGRYVFVVNTNGDSISVLDAATTRVVQTIVLQPFPSAPYGSSPTDVLLKGSQLFVSLGRNNAVAVYDWRGPSEPARLLGLLPVGEYPSSLAAASGQVLVTNLKGVGSVSDADAGKPARGVGGQVASVSFVPLPDRGVLSRGTHQVAANNGWDRIQRACPRKGIAAVPVPARIGEPSPITHVVYLIKENRTYDQVLGDVGRGSSDPKLAVFGRAVTPNQHALATRWPLFDNYYASGRRSNDGHNWAVQADVPDYLEKQLSSRRTDLLAGGTPPSSGFDALLYLPSGFLWENALAAGLSIADFGEYTSEEVSPPARTDIASLRPYVAPEYPGFNLSFPDVDRARLFKNRLTGWSASGSMPNLTLMTLSNDHTGGSNPQYPTPPTQVADNDLATGQIVEALSSSPFWASTAVFIEEDDAQGGPDHVDGHRSTLFVASPYAQRGGVISTAYNQVNVVRTIEQILGLPAMNQLDLAAQPMTEAFTSKPDLSPYTALVPASTPATNAPLASLTGIQREWALAMGFEDLTHLDAANEQLLNRDTWYASTGWTRPYPGDARVLHPSEVPVSRRGQGPGAVEVGGDRPASDLDRSTGSGLDRPVAARAAAAACAVSLRTAVPQDRASAVATRAPGLAATGLSPWVAGLASLTFLLLALVRAGRTVWS